MRLLGLFVEIQEGLGIPLNSRTWFDGASILIERLLWRIRCCCNGGVKLAV